MFSLSLLNPALIRDKEKKILLYSILDDTSHKNNSEFENRFWCIKIETLQTK